MYHLALSVVILLFSFNVYAIPSKAPSQEQIQQMVDANELLSELNLIVPRSSRGLDDEEFLRGVDVEIYPYAEYEKQKYFIFNDETHFSSLQIKEEFLSNLPEGIIPVIYTKNQSPEFLNSLRETFSSFLKDPSVLRVVTFEGRGTAFWARDTIPVPVLLKGESETKLGVVDAKYYHHYEPDKSVAEHFNADKFSHEYYFEGGNFLATTDGTCAVVNVSAVRRIPDNVFEKLYGCKDLIRFPHVKGIGHMDESLKFIGNNIAVTDLPQYEKMLSEKGFDVILFPKALQQYETYLNSVLLNDTVYVPVFGREEDDEALAAYRNLGYHVVPINSYYLSNDGLGSLHCISMVYPDIKQF